MIFIVFRNIYDYLSVPFEGYKSEKYKVVLDKKYGGIIEPVYAFHHSISRNRRHSLPLKKIWYRWSFNISEMKKCQEDGEHIVLLFFEGNRLAYQNEYIEYLRKNYKDATFAFRFVNVIDEKSEWALDFVKNKYDMVLSMDEADCSKYELVYAPNTFWYDRKRLRGGCETDFLFLGHDKGRHDQLIHLAQRCEESHINYDFFITGVPERKRQYNLSGLHYIKGMNYEEYLGRVNNAKVLIELISVNQVGSTLRAMEAVFFDKVLLSNNLRLKEELYYDNYGMVISDAEMKDIDVLNVVDRKPLYDSSLVDHDRLFEIIEKNLLGIV